MQESKALLSRDDAKSLEERLKNNEIILDFPITYIYYHKNSDEATLFALIDESCLEKFLKDNGYAPKKIEPAGKYQIKEEKEMI